jgi:hypothetical protein
MRVFLSNIQDRHRILGHNPIVERVKAGLRNAKAKGKRLGRPRRVVDARQLRAEGFGWKRIATDLGVGVGTICRGSKIQERDFGTVGGHLQNRATAHATTKPFRIVGGVLRRVSITATPWAGPVGSHQSGDQNGQVQHAEDSLQDRNRARFGRNRGNSSRSE